ncbi:MAG: hypothetical protein ACE5JX_10985 [Acidobacteriota bacterium]
MARSLFRVLFDEIFETSSRHLVKPAKWTLRSFNGETIIDRCLNQMERVEFRPALRPQVDGRLQLSLWKASKESVAAATSFGFTGTSFVHRSPSSSILLAN